uniref:Uncharacterized protein n=1 Tax=Strigamia maritima TaxID=126957 RepID=T1IUJ3_STRMM
MIKVILLLFAFALCVYAGYDDRDGYGGYGGYGQLGHGYGHVPYGHGGYGRSSVYHEQNNDGHGYGTYKFGYEVNDPHTQNQQSRHETKDGHGTVRGSYKLKDADGHVRVVEYIADKHNGFRALVNGIPHY